MSDFLLTVIKTLERMRPGMLCYGYGAQNVPGTNTWYEIVLSDVDWYLKDARFKQYAALMRRTAAQRFGAKLVFVACTPQEERLVRLLEDNNLIMSEAS